MSKLRVLLLMHGLHLTGAPRIALDVMEALSGETEVWTVALQLGPLEERARALGRVDAIGDPADRVSAAKRLIRRQQRPALSAALAAWKPDLIYVNSVAALPALRWVRLPDSVPLLLHVHELHSYLEHYAAAYPDEMLHRPDRYVAVSEPVRRALVSDLGVAEAKVTLMHEFVPDGAVAATEALFRQRDGQQGDPPVVGGAGRVDLRKAPTLWLQTARCLTDRMGEGRVRFTWVGLGDDDASRQFRVMARQLGLSEHVTFVPVTPEPLPHFAGFDAFAMTSWEDPCPIVVLEAMLLGKPVACFDGSGGAPEEVGDTGLIVPEFSPARMAEALATLFAEPGRRAAMGRAARERVRDRFSAAAQVPRIRAEIQRLAGREVDSSGGGGGAI
jgi:glycosyltransferase involved in cell wall biosynthesis